MPGPPSSAAAPGDPVRGSPGGSVAFACAAASAFLGLVGLAGWVVPWRHLAKALPPTISMAPVTALAVLVLAAATILEARRPSVPRTAAFALLALAPSAATFAGFLVGLPAWPDPLPALDLERFGGTQTGRMSPLAAAGLVLASLALLLVSLARRWRACGAVGAGLALLTSLLGVTVALGYLHGAQVERGGRVVFMAFSAGLALTGLGAALVSFAPRDAFPLRLVSAPAANARLLRAFLPLAPAVVGVNLLVSSIPDLNPAVKSVLEALLSATVVAALVVLTAGAVSRDLDGAEAERERARRAVDRLAAIVESSSDAIWATDLNGTILSWNPERFARVFESRLVAIGIGEVGSGRLVDVNERWAELFGYTRQEMIGRTASELGLWVDAAERETLTAGIGEGRVSQLEVRLRHKSGEIRHAIASMEAMTLSGVPEPLGLVAIVDLTERRQLEGQLRQAQKMEAIGRLDRSRPAGAGGDEPLRQRPRRDARGRPPPHRDRQRRPRRWLRRPARADACRPLRHDRRERRGHRHPRGDPGQRVRALLHHEGAREGDRSAARHGLRHREAAGGHVWVYSEVGRGTTFKVYLPRADEPASAPRPESERPARGSETVLLVEDEPSLRAISREILVENGYVVLDAGGAAEAAEIASRHRGPIDLLVRTS